MDTLHTQFIPCVTTAFEEILDKMAFMVFEPTGSGGLPHDQFAYTSRIAFTGRLSGSMTVYLTRATAEEFARNLIGIRNGDDLRRETLEDALREFCNILMGRTLSLLASDEHFDLQLPVAQPADPEGPEALLPTLRLEGMLNEEEPCRIDVTLN
jgi:CheY-specific phosphatase CheX